MILLCVVFFSSLVCFFLTIRPCLLLEAGTQSRTGEEILSYLPVWFEAGKQSKHREQLPFEKGSEHGIWEFLTNYHEVLMTNYHEVLIKPPEVQNPIS